MVLIKIICIESDKNLIKMSYWILLLHFLLLQYESQLGWWKQPNIWKNNIFLLQQTYRFFCWWWLLLSLALIPKLCLTSSEAFGDTFCHKQISQNASESLVETLDPRLLMRGPQFLVTRGLVCWVSVICHGFASTIRFDGENDAQWVIGRFWYFSVTHPYHIIMYNIIKPSILVGFSI